MSRLYRRPTHCKWGHRFTPANTYTQKSTGWRSCRRCGRKRAKAYQKKIRSQGAAHQKPPEWHREYRTMVKAGLRVPQKRKAERQYVTRNVLDLLELDGGWLTAEGLALDLGFDPETVDRTLYRLRQKNLVQSRVVELALSSAGRLQSRSEWRWAA